MDEINYLLELCCCFAERKKPQKQIELTSKAVRFSLTSKDGITKIVKPGVDDIEEPQVELSSPMCSVSL